MKNIFIVNAHVSSPEKENILCSALSQLKKCEGKILVVSNSILSKDTISLCDYYVYDKEDQLLPTDKTPTKWFADSEYTVHLYSRGNSFSIVKNLNIGLNFARNLGFEKFITMEYDNIIHDGDLQKLQNLFDVLQYKNAFFCRTIEWNAEWFESRIFSGDIRFFLDNIVLPTKLETWYTTYPYSSNIETLEYLYPILFAQYPNEVAFFNGTNKAYFTNSKIDVNTSIPEATIAYNTDNILTPFLFLVGTDTEYTVRINDEHIESIYMSRGEWKRYKLDISLKECIVEVVKDTTTKTFSVSQNNIEEYKNFAMMYKL